MAYVISWFYWLYYVFSTDDTFPKDADVKNALKKSNDKKSEEILSECCVRFWLQPATTLQGLLPGILDAWDNAYTGKLPNFEGTSFFNSHDPEWMTAYREYADAMIDEMAKLSQASSYAKLPTRAVARMRYFLHAMVGYHYTTVFPTKTFIQEMATTFHKAREAFCDVSQFSTLFYGKSWRDP